MVSDDIDSSDIKIRMRTHRVSTNPIVIGPKFPGRCSVCGKAVVTSPRNVMMHVVVDKHESWELLAKKRTYKYLVAEIHANVCDVCLNRHKTYLQGFLNAVVMLLIIVAVVLGVMQGWGWASLLISIPVWVMCIIIQCIIVKLAGEQSPVCDDDIIEVKEMEDLGWSLGDRPYGGCIGHIGIEDVKIPQYN